MKKILYLFIAFAFAGVFNSCDEESLEPTLEHNKLYEGNVNTDEDLAGLLNGIMNRMTQTAYYGRDYVIFGEVRTDNCFANGRSGRFLTPASLTMGNSDAFALDTWRAIYRVIASCNVIIDASKTNLTGDVNKINDIVGQAYAIRALAHFDLLKLYGQQHVTTAPAPKLGIPYAFTYKGEGFDQFPKRNTVDEVKGFIYADLDKALTLTAAYAGTSIYVSKDAVSAIKARVAIYFGEWNTAKTACEAVINSGNYSILSKDEYLASWKKKDNVNAIFELFFDSKDHMDINGIQNIYRGTSYGDIRVLKDLFDIFGVATSTDLRYDASMLGIQSDGRANYRTNIGKYPADDYSDNIKIARYEEVILNYAEALFETNTTGLGGNDALYYLNLIPAQRAQSLPPVYTVANKTNILLERRKELCFEGFRFDDLVRTGIGIPKILGTTQQRFAATIPYGDTRLAFPIPQVELNANSNMVQNAGY